MGAFFWVHVCGRYIYVKSSLRLLIAGECTIEMIYNNDNIMGSTGCVWSATGSPGLSVEKEDHHLTLIGKSWFLILQSQTPSPVQA